MHVIINIYNYKYIYRHTFLGKTNAKLKGKVTKAEGKLKRFGLKTNCLADEDVPWQLSTSDLRLAIERLHHIVVPSHLDFKAQNVFTHPTRLKSHDWKQVITIYNIIYV